MIVRATDDIYSPVKWAYWLAGELPGAEDPIELESARLLLPKSSPISSTSSCASVEPNIRPSLANAPSLLRTDTLWGLSPVLASDSDHLPLRLTAVVRAVLALS